MGQVVFFSPSLATFRVLTVCTANVCRSPGAERLLAAALGKGVSVSSAGTQALVGASIDNSIAVRLRRRGLPDGGFQARQLKVGQARGSDLLLPLTVWHRSQVQTLAPLARNRTFTLLEFARIVGAPEFPAIHEEGVRRRLLAMVKLAARNRELGEIISDDSVPDPFGKGPEVTEASFRLMEQSVGVIARVARAEAVRTAL